MLKPAVAGAVGGHAATRNAARNSNSNSETGLKQLTDAINKQTDYLGRLISQSVDTVDTLIYEWETQELPTGATEFTVTVQPQTRQLERIDSLFVAIANPTLIAGGTITLDNAWAKLGNTYVNLNAIVNSAGGTGGAVPTPLGLLVNADDIRSFNIHATAPFPAGFFMSIALCGHAIPATLGEVLT